MAKEQVHLSRVLTCLPSRRNPSTSACSRVRILDQNGYKDTRSCRPRFCPRSDCNHCATCFRDRLVDFGVLEPPSLGPEIDLGKASEHVVKEAKADGRNATYERYIDREGQGTRRREG